jgi:hypothetical protein
LLGSDGCNEEIEVIGIVAPTLGALARHIVIGGLWRPVKRRAEAELVAELHTVRYPSFPFISSDTFRAMADIVIEGATFIRRSKVAQRNIIFFDLADVTGDESELSDSPGLQALDRVLSELPVPPVVLMSHGDLLPKKSLLTRIGERSAKVFAVNLVEETDKLSAIPLGLENLSRNRNGRLRDFDAARQPVDTTAKTNEVFAAFEPDNNPEVREPLIELLRSSRFGWNRGRVSPEDFRRAVRESLFVISPPGRGFDCHRTWEAIYLGAVPVVLTTGLAPSLLSSLPILAVDDYDQFLELSSRDMSELYSQVKDRSPEAAFMPFWCEAILRLGSA